MRKKLALLTLSTAIALTACGGGAPAETTAAQTTAVPETTQAETTTEAETNTEAETEPEDDGVYEIGETWEVEGQWKITVDSITATDDRNEFADTDPAAVYIIEYTYENLGYEDESGMMDGLFVDFSMGQIVDAEKFMGYSYPGDQELYAQEVPVGAKMKAQSVIGVDNPGSFTVTLSMYDGNGNEQEATFNCVVE